MSIGGAKVFTVTEVNSYIRNLLERDFALRRVTVQGEVSNCKYHNSGHIYFTLKDGTGALAAVMFARDRIGLRFRMQEGQQVRVTGRFSVYEKNGVYQLYAQVIEPAGRGELYQRFEELKERLSEMGMFDEMYKRPVPRYAMNIGIVTAPDGAAVRDIEKVARGRNPCVRLVLYPAIVQGEYAVPSIVSGIQRLDRMGLDVLIVGRGGGSIEELWAFNEEAVARAIFDCRTPVISAVGHETDVTIADLVADRRAATPTESAQIAVFELAAYDREIEGYASAVRRAMRRRIEYERMRLRQAAYRMDRLTPRHRLDNQRQEAADLEDRLLRQMRKTLSDYRNRLTIVSARIDGASPLKKMSGGYAYAEDKAGRAIRSAGQTVPGDEITVQLTDGRILAEVLSVTMESCQASE